MRATRRLLPLVVAVVLVGLLFLGYRRVTTLPPRIEVTQARTEDVVRVLAVTGRIRPRLTTRVQSLVSGTVLTLAREEGDAVRRGDVLATLDAQSLRANIAQARAQAAARRADAEQRQRDHDRTVRLAAAGGIPDAEAEAARTALETAMQALRQTEAAVAETESRLRDYTLRSPIDGVVLARAIDPGQNVTPQTVLYEIATGSDSEIEMEVDEQFLGELATGLGATVAPLTGERRQLEARITYIGRRVSETSGAVPVRLAFIGAAPRLPAGLSVDVNLRIAEHPQATTIPRAAVAGLGTDPYVMLVRSDTIERRPVRVIDWPSPRIVVLEGLTAGDVVALTPKLVREGLAVRTIAAPDAL
ncbi:MAG: efflux RND transporter periplasmic adaptor subunit [Gemmatimonadaceae bacterium]